MSKAKRLEVLEAAAGLDAEGERLQLERIERGLVQLHASGAIAQRGRVFVALDGTQATAQIARILTAANERQLKTRG